MAISAAVILVAIMAVIVVFAEFLALICGYGCGSYCNYGFIYS